MTGPLAGVRVVELGSFIAAPFASQILADLGADVLKIEPPGGDGLRSWGAQAPSGSSWWSCAQNRGKRLGCLDLAHPDGPAVVRRLLAGADVLIENFRPGTLERWGLGPGRIAAEFPRLVYVAISGYGLTGPNRDLPGFGNVAEARGGLRYVTGYPDRPPVRTGVSLGDAAAGLYAVIGALASLYARERDPRQDGDVVDVALTDAVLSLTVIIEVADPGDPALGPVTMLAGMPRLLRRHQRPASTGGAIGRDTRTIADWAGLREGQEASR